jgi:hypothetical protein
MYVNFVNLFIFTIEKFSFVIYLWLYSPSLCFGRLFHFLNLYTAGRTPWMAGSACHKAATYTQNKRTQTSMPQVGIRSHDTNVGAGEHGSYFRSRRH